MAGTTKRGVGRPKKQPALQPPLEEREAVVCTRCGRTYRGRKRNFPPSQSSLFRCNGGGYLTVCYSCVDELFKEQRKILGSDKDAAKRVCMKLDAYYNEALFDTVCKSAKVETLMHTYISKTSAYRYAGKTYTDTIADDVKAIDVSQDLAASTPAQIKSEDVDFWGTGYSAAEYDEMNRRFRRWADGQGELDMGAETLYRQICMLEVAIRRNIAEGKSTEQTVKQLNDLVGSVNAKPVQKKTEDSADAGFDALPFGVGIKMFENTRPVPKPIPELADVDGVRKYITVWLLGHLCHMLHVKNGYSRMYEEEMQRLRVSRPDIADEEDDDFLTDLFGGEGGSEDAAE